MFRRRKHFLVANSRLTMHKTIKTLDALISVPGIVLRTSKLQYGPIVNRSDPQNSTTGPIALMEQYFPWDLTPRIV